MARREKYIPGIYNYCDRWCERCPFTARCRNFSMEQKMLRLMARRGEKEPDPRPDFWETFMTPWDEHQRREAEAKREAKRQEAEGEPLARRAKAYATGAGEWMKKNGKGCADEEAFAVIAWYHVFILVKLMRAARTDDDEEEADDTGEMDRDAEDEEIKQVLDRADRDDENGSAKVALIGIDRSLVAWQRLAAAGDPVAAKMIDQLVALRDVAEQVFPAARRFIRPGLDE